MIYTIFYSWQSDLPNNKNRSFIESSIKKAIKLNKVSSESKIFMDYDRDTKGISGSPDICETIFNKIDKSDIFICDISIINKEIEGRKTPNPNVLLELGYAAKVLGWERIICLFNLKYGEVNDLPFDLSHKRILFYDSEKEKEKDRISKIISDSIQHMYSSGLLYNPLKDHVKGKIDYCILEILKHICSIVYGTITLSESLELVVELLDCDEERLKLKLSERNNILGFFAHKNLNRIKDMLNDNFAMISSSSYYQSEWAVTVLQLIEWIRSFQWHISDRRENLLFIKRFNPNIMFDVISATKTNESNPKDSYILIKKIGNDSGKVLNTGTMPKVDKKYLISPYRININEIERFSKCILRIIEISNMWLDKNGNEFLLDPEYYDIHN